MADDLHLLPRHRRMIEGLARQHLPGIEIWAYGSRVNGESHDGSDLDLVLRGLGLAEVPTSQFARFREALTARRCPSWWMSTTGRACRRDSSGRSSANTSS